MSEHASAIASNTASGQSDSASHAGEDSRRAVVGCQQLSKVFKDFWMRDRARAVDKLDLVIYEHEVFGLLGPNGSGKSTIIKLILGLLKPTHGRISVFGKPPSDVMTKERIGYLPEESYLYPFLNARETLEYYGKLFGIDRKVRQGRIDELLEMVGLEHAQFRPVREYSKGMQRRIGIAQALINDPELLILDEPTTGLDPIGIRQVKDLIIELGRRGKTVILSSHLLTDVEDVVDRMAILYGGKIRDEGTCDKLLTSTERTLLETDELDEQTISEIDELIRRRTGGEKSIRTVTAPRQKLEEIFLGIVEKAQSERASTSGAMQGGQTAAFLRDEREEVQQGEALIDSLLSDQAGPQAVEAIEPATPSGTQHSNDQPIEDQPPSTDEAVIDSLLKSDDALAAVDDSSADSSSGSTPDEDVDLGVIGNLLDEDQDSAEDSQENKQ
ncbi:MAG: ABC transporter ATP-binding protein [Phycisphaerales bacterium]